MVPHADSVFTVRIAKVTARQLKVYLVHAPADGASLRQVCACAEAQLRAAWGDRAVVWVPYPRRVTWHPEELRVLMAVYAAAPYPDAESLSSLAVMFGARLRSVKFFFQNRRQRKACASPEAICDATRLTVNESAPAWIPSESNESATRLDEV